MAEKILSVNNEKVKTVSKLLQKKYREESKKFLIENFKGIEEAYRLGLRIESVFVTEEKAERFEFLKDRLIYVTEAVLGKISDTKTAPEAVAVAAQPEFERSLLKSAKRVVLFEGIKDAGNLGTVIRISAAFDVDAIVLYGDTIDIYNPKCVRAAVGNLCKTPIFHFREFKELSENFSGFEKIATLPRGEAALSEFSGKPPWLVMFGSEAEGLSEKLVDFADTSVKIEMKQGVESLNLGVSAGIVLYKLFVN